jgi:TRAP-type mannitol/chloroaromatic compound transport system substrate-binding protein
MMIVKRRQVLTAAAGGMAASAIAAPAVAQSMPEVKWRLASSFLRGLDTIFGTAQTLARYIAEATDNRFQIQTFAADEIAPRLVLDAVQSGSVECAQTPINFYRSKDPTLAFGTGVPFGLNARMQHSWWHFGGGAEIITPALAKFNVIGFPMGNSGTQMGGFFRKELNSPEDLKGLRFRIAGFGAEVLSRFGVVPQQIASGDVYPALKNGTIDATEFVGPYDDEKLGFHKIAKYYYYPSWWEGGAMMHLVVNLEQWNKLPKPYRRILQDGCEAANNWMLARYDSVNAPALRRLVADGAVLKPFPQPMMEAFYNSAHDIYNETAASDPTFKQALHSYTGFRNEQLPWWQVGELSFDSFMARMRARS